MAIDPNIERIEACVNVAYFKWTIPASFLFALCPPNPNETVFTSYLKLVLVFKPENPISSHY